MPNHVTNILKIVGEKSDVESILSSFKGTEENGFIDFNKIIPMPESIRNTVSDGLSMWLDNPFSENDSFGNFKNSLQNFKEEQIDNFLKCLKNYHKYGSSTWYDWSVANWGTKWNAYSQELVEFNVIKFETAWSFPEQILVTLSEKFPTTKFEHQYADEDVGRNCGYGYYLNGIYTKEDLFDIDEDAAYEFACKLTGYERYLEDEEE